MGRTNFLTPAWIARQALRYCLLADPAWRWPVLLVWTWHRERLGEPWYQDESPLLLCPPDAWIGWADDDVGTVSQAIKQLVRSTLARERDVYV